MKHMTKALLVSTAIMTISGSGWAQPVQPAAEASADDQIVDIVVTARKREESLISVPVQVSAISGETLAARGVVSISQLAQQVPNFIAAPSLLIDAIYIRGIGTTPSNVGFEQSVGIFVDGVYYGNGRWVNQGFFDVASAQVLKGPQGVYFGKNTIAGALDITTRKPGREFEGMVRAGYEIEDHQRYVEAGVSVPLSETFAVRVYGRLDKMRGWVHNRFEDKYGPNNYDRFARVTLRWTPTDTLDVTLKSQVFESDNDSPQGNWILPVCQGPGNTASPTSFGPSPVQCGRDFFQITNNTTPFGDLYTKYSNFAHTLNINWDVGPGALTAITGWNRYKMDFLSTSSISVGNSVYSRQLLRNEAISQELRYATNLEGIFNATAGLFYQSTDFKANNRARVLPDAFQGTVGGQPTWTWIKPSTQDGKSFAIFGEARAQILPVVEAAIGGRYTEEKKKSQMRNTSAAPNLPFLLTPSYAANQKFKNFSPTATLTWRPNNDTTLFGAYKQGFKAGGFSHGATIFFLPPGSPPPAASLVFGSEKVKGFEVGLKGYALGRRVRYELGAYRYNYSDLQVNAYNPNTNSFTVANAASATQRGVEASLAVRAAPGLNLNGSINYNVSKFKRFIGSCNSLQVRGTAPCNVPLGTTFGQDLSGNSTPYAPRVSGRADISYETDLSADMSFRANAGAQYSGRFRMMQDNRPDNVQKSYVRINAGVGIGLMDDKLKFDIIGQNLTNRIVYTVGSERSSAGRDLIANVDRGRQIDFRITYDF